MKIEKKKKKTKKKKITKKPSFSFIEKLLKGDCQGTCHDLTSDWKNIEIESMEALSLIEKIKHLAFVNHFKVTEFQSLWSH